ncbi:MAG TPA: tetratricopeptide repeat protein [Ignavibacteriales bacterium]|nr:tetratricopeptide repeat protein [Ignavibacteriales bacterium]
MKILIRLEKSIRIIPYYTLTYNNRAAAYHNIQDFDAANRDFNKVIQLNEKFKVCYSI